MKLAANEFWGLVTKRGKVMLESESEPYPALSSPLKSNQKPANRNPYE